MMVVWASLLVLVLLWRRIVGSSGTSGFSFFSFVVVLTFFFKCLLMSQVHANRTKRGFFEFPVCPGFPRTKPPR